jgi:DNA-binding transcriptional ArsR family regulator
MQLIARSKAAEILAALGSEHRLKIVELLRGGERCVCEITPEFELDPSVVSRHLAVLEKAGIIVSRRSGRWIHYRIADRRALRLLEGAHRMAEAPRQARSVAAKNGEGRRAC